MPRSEVLDLPDAAAGHYAEIRADLKKRAALIGANDLLIAAHARSLGLVLVTNPDRFNALDEEEQETFRNQLEAFVRLYGFLSQVMPFTDRDLETRYSFCRLPVCAGTRGLSGIVRPPWPAAV